MPELTATIHKVREYLGYLVAVFFLFPVLWVSYFIAAWAFVCIVIVVLDIPKITRRDLLNMLFYSSQFFVLIVSSWVHKGSGAAFLERGLSFIVFPIAVFLSQMKITKQGLVKLSWVFLIGVVLLAIKGLLLYFIVPPFLQYDAQHDFIFRYRTEFNFNTHIAPSYASLYFSFAILLVFLQLDKIAVNHRSFILILTGFLFLQLILLSAKMPMIALALVFILLLARKNISFAKKNKKRIIIIGSLGMVLIVLLFLFTRWNELFTGINYQNIAQTENSVGIRKGITQCALELSGEHFLWGVGPQNVQNELNYCYYQFEGNDFDRHTFNTHNQYLDYLIGSGILGLLVLLLVIGRPIYKAIKGNEPILLSLMVLIGLCMLTENMLSRQAGIVFYAFFQAVLINRLEDKKLD
jgi:O-antigen ligase